MTFHNDRASVERKSINGEVREAGLEAGLPSPTDGYGETQNDVNDMLRLGKKQEFKVTECRVDQWRVCWIVLGIHWDGDMLFVNRGVARRNGVNGSYERCR
ncbi:hypothetical protein ACHAPF_006040 [Botrytis cinerea]